MIHEAFHYAGLQVMDDTMKLVDGLLSGRFLVHVTGFGIVFVAELN